MRIVFFGTPEFAAPTLRELLRGPDPVVGVVCQPDRPAGRGQKLVAPPVKEVAAAAGIAVVQPEKIRTQEFYDQLSAFAPDLIVVIAYGRILPKTILDLPPQGCINVHASLLPKYRGAAPIQWAIYNGEAETGITIMRINERMDAGDMLLQRTTHVAPEESYGELQERLAELGSRALRDALEQLRAGTLVATPQNEAIATHAPMIEKENGRIDWSTSATQLALMVRAFNPWPSAYTFVAGKRLQIHRATARATETHESPGTIIQVADAIAIATGSGVLFAHELQLEGRRRLSAAEIARSGLLKVGDHLG